MDLRTRRRERTRRDIEAAAFELFLEHGYDETTMPAIAEAAGVSLSTLFRYAGSKEQLVLQGGSDAFDVVQEALREQPPDEPVLSALHAAIDALGEIYEERRTEVAQRFELVHAVPALQGRFVELLTALEDRLVAVLGERGVAEADARLVAAATTTAIRVSTRTWRPVPGGPRYPELARRNLDVLVGGTLDRLGLPSEPAPPLP